MSSIGFDAGLKSLLTAQAALQTIGNNIANANTPGFARQQVLLADSMPLQMGGFSFGTGVDIAKIRRIVDEGLEQRLRFHSSILARLNVESTGFQQLEGFLQNAGGSGLSSVLGNVFTSFAGLASHPEDAIGRKDVLTQGDSLAAALRELRNHVNAFKKDQQALASIRVEEVNTLTSQIAQLNLQIKALKGKGYDPHALADQRQQLLTQLSQIVEITTIDDPNGTMRVLAAGHSIVSDGKSFDLELTSTPAGDLDLKIKGGVGTIALGNGAVAGLLRMGESAGDSLVKQADLFAKSLILAFNRVHSTGLPASGGFTSLLGAEKPTQGILGTTVPLSAAGYPIPMQKGDLYLTVTEKATGAMEVTKVAIDPNESLVDLAAKLSAIPNVSASIDGEGHLQISSKPGFQFGFSPALDTNPDAGGAFGGASASVSSSGTAPFNLTNGATLQIAVDGGPAQTITFNAGQFVNIAAATAEEVAAAINSQLTGGSVKASNGILTLQSNATGTASSILVTDGAGAPNAALGFSMTLDTGSATSSSVKVSGTYSGTSNDAWTFKPDSDGTIGVTPGLTVGVFDGQGNRIATLDVGTGYSPGTEVLVKDGVKISFGPGDLSQTANDAFSLNVIGDADTSDVLVSLGLNTFFTGVDATDIAVRQDLFANPDLLAGSLTGAAGDGMNLNRLIDLQQKDLDELGGVSLTEFVASMSAGLGLDTKRAIDLESAEVALVTDLSAQREQVSGVSLEEEMANLVRFQQAFDAAGRYMKVLQDTNASLLDMIR